MSVFIVFRKKESWPEHVELICVCESEELANSKCRRLGKDTHYWEEHKIIENL